MIICIFYMMRIGMLKIYNNGYMITMLNASLSF